MTLRFVIVFICLCVHIWNGVRDQLARRIRFLPFGHMVIGLDSKTHSLTHLTPKQSFSCIVN